MNKPFLICRQHDCVENHNRKKEKSPKLPKLMSIAVYKVNTKKVTFLYESIDMTFSTTKKVAQSTPVWLGTRGDGGGMRRKYTAFSAVTELLYVIIAGVAIQMLNL